MRVRVCGCCVKFQTKKKNVVYEIPFVSQRNITFRIRIIEDYCNFLYYFHFILTFCSFYDHVWQPLVCGVTSLFTFP